MRVTQLIQDIGKCRDILETKDVKTVLKNIYLFEKVWSRAKREVGRYMKDENYEVDFTYCDLQELSDEIFAFIKNHQTKFTFANGHKKLIKNKTIDNVILSEFYREQCDWMYVDAKLREAYKILGYFAIVLWLWSEARHQQGFDYQVTQLIRSFL